jgi:hypothetical protein
MKRFTVNGQIFQPDLDEEVKQDRNDKGKGRTTCEFFRGVFVWK